ncbi:MAG TPA: pyruvate kinase [Candidatus Paceibacterota bacterium]
MHLGKKTKIVATIGPVTTSQEQLEKLLKAGLNVVRLNFSHGDFAEHQEKVDNARAASKKTGIPVAILQDLSGPKIRIGTFHNDPAVRITVKAGQKFTFSTDPKTVGDETKAYINYEKLPKEIKKGEAVLVDDGKVRMVCTDIKDTEVICKVINGAELKGKRGVNLPDSDLTISALTAKDKKDIEFGEKNNVDYVAFSFVRKASEAAELRKILDKRGMKHTKIIAKIETPQALENFDEILEIVDGAMVARGDLAVEIPAQKVPLAQKTIIEKCNEAGKPVITATQMLESMIKNPVPTRAEVSDVANAMLDGTDAVMLSEETTLGSYPVEAVTMMANIAAEVENDVRHSILLAHPERLISDTLSKSISAAAAQTAESVGAKYIVALTEFGAAAALASRQRVSVPVLAMTPDQKTYNQMCLYFGVYPIMMPKKVGFREAHEEAKALLVKEKLVKKGDKLVFISGTPFKEAEETNMIMVEQI